MTKTKRNQLTIYETNVLVALQEKPLATFEELASMTNLAKSVVFGIVKKLEDTTISPPYFSVVGLPHLHNLGLRHIDVIVKADSQKKLQIIKKVCLEHPYIMFYSRTYGDVNGMLIQLRNPLGSINLIEKFFQKLKNNGYIDDFTILQIAFPQIITTIKINVWNSEFLSWNFSWEDWFKKEIISKPLSSKHSSMQSDLPGSSKNWLKQQDIAILGELFWNARRKNSDMIERLNKRGWDITIPTFSRRLKLIKEECIETYRVYINPKTFDILNTFLVWGYGDEKKLQEIKNRMQSYPIPFTSTLKIENYQIYWSLHLPTSQMSDFLFYLRPILSELHFNFIDYPRTKTFLPFIEAWDEKTKNWRIDEDFCINQVLRSLKQDKKN